MFGPSTKEPQQGQTFMCESNFIQKCSNRYMVLDLLEIQKVKKNIGVKKTTFFEALNQKSISYRLFYTLMHHFSM